MASDESHLISACDDVIPNQYGEPCKSNILKPKDTYQHLQNGVVRKMYNRFAPVESLGHKVIENVHQPSTTHDSKWSRTIAFLVASDIGELSTERAVPNESWMVSFNEGVGIRVGGLSRLTLEDSEEESTTFVKAFICCSTA